MKGLVSVTLRCMFCHTLNELHCEMTGARLNLLACCACGSQNIVTPADVWPITGRHRLCGHPYDDHVLLERNPGEWVAVGCVLP